MSKALKNPEWVDFARLCRVGSVEDVLKKIIEYDSIQKKKFILNHFSDIIPIDNRIIHALFYKNDKPIFNYGPYDFEKLVPRLNLNILDKENLKIILFNQLHTDIINDKDRSMRKYPKNKNLLSWKDFEKETINGWKIENNQIVPYSNEKDDITKFVKFCDKRIEQIEKENEIAARNEEIKDNNEKTKERCQQMIKTLETRIEEAKKIREEKIRNNVSEEKIKILDDQIKATEDTLNTAKRDLNITN